MFTELTDPQRSQIAEYQQIEGIEVRLVGLDAREWPVLWVRDVRPQPHTVAIRPPDGWPRQYQYPLRFFTDEEVERMPTGDAELLFCMSLQSIEGSGE